jgi:protocatechuate 3,4-dioxygenase beta subunit
MSIEQNPVRRREALVGGAVAAGAVAGAYFLNGPRMIADALAVAPSASDAAACTLSKEVTEGPYWIDTSLSRRNITEGKKGAKLALFIKVIDASTCKPIKGADVEIWHADAAGEYSGFDGGSSGGPPGSGAQTSSRYLRGHQKSDSTGRVRFDTLYPGWYQGRTPHIHVKVHVGGKEIHTGQIFFTDATSRKIYRTGVYKSRGKATTTNSEDSIYKQATGKARARITKRSGNRGFKGTITVGVDA